MTTVDVVYLSIWRMVSSEGDTMITVEVILILLMVVMVFLHNAEYSPQ